MSEWARDIGALASTYVGGGSLLQLLDGVVNRPNEGSGARRWSMRSWFGVGSFTAVQR
jgi:hypothetical protein